MNTLFISILILAFCISFFISYEKKTITWSCAIAPLALSMAYTQILMGVFYAPLALLLTAFVVGIVSLLGCSIGAIIGENLARRGQGK